MNSQVFAPIAVALVLGAVPVISQACGHCGHEELDTASEGHAQHGGTTAQAARIIQIAVTADGFTPAKIRLKRGETVTLMVTRTIDETCAKEIVIPEYRIRKPLPMGEPVAIELTPTKSGSVRYACGMDMISGVLVVH